MLRFVMVEADLFDTVNNTSVTLRMRNSVQIGFESAGSVQFEPVLLVPIIVGVTVEDAILKYGGSSGAGSGRVDFFVNDRVRPYLEYASLGRACRVYLAELDDEFEGDPWSQVTQVYDGLIAGLDFDAVEMRATMTLRDKMGTLDVPLVPEVYPDDAPTGVKGRPKPRVFGACKSCDPVLAGLSDDISGQPPGLPKYDISYAGIYYAYAARVDGIPWSYNPGGLFTPGQWRWTFQYVIFGGSTLGGEIRIDVDAQPFNDAEAYLPATLLTLMVELAGLSVDDTNIDDFKFHTQYTAGYYARDPINLGAALDEFTIGIGAIWNISSAAGTVQFWPILPPSGIPVATYDERNIISISAKKRIAPVHRVRVEYRRNWQPATRFVTFVTDDEKAAMSAGGIVAEPVSDDDVKTREPDAVDMPLVRSVVLSEAQAIDLRDRLWGAYGIARRLWAVQIAVDGPLPGIMDVVSLDFEGTASGLCRVVGITRSIGEHNAEVVLWG